MADLKAYFSLGSCSFGNWLDSRHIVYTRTGPEGKSIITQDLETGAQTTLFNTKESLRALYVAKNGDVFFGMDNGGAENLQIHRIPREGGPIVAVTDDASTYHQLGGLAADGTTLVVASNRRVKSTFDIVGIDLATGSQRVILENSDNYNMPAGLSPCGRYLLVNKLMGANNNPLWMVDIETGAAAKTPPGSAHAADTHPVWKHDSSAFYYVSDFDSEFAYIAYYDLQSETGQKLLSYPWDVENLALSHDDRYLAFTVNEGGYTSLYVYDLTAGDYVSIPSPPKGTISGYVPMHWAPDEHKLLFAAAGATRAQNLWVLDVDGDSVRRATNSHMAGLTTADFCEPTLHSFKSFDGLEVPYFLYMPKGSKGNMPVMVDIHGGPEGQSVPGVSHKELLHYMVSQGIAVVEPNIRGSSGYGKTYLHLDDVEKRLDSVTDIEYLVKHLVETGVADAKRIGVMGGSYGGFMTLSCAARLPQLWCCAVCTVGMFNLVTFLENTSDYRRPHRESEYGTLAHHRDVLYHVSPIACVDNIRGPLMIIHGQNDPRVPVSESHQAAEYLAAHGVDVEMLIYPDEGHGLQKLDNQLDCYPKVMDFVFRSMKLEG